MGKHKVLWSVLFLVFAVLTFVAVVSQSKNFSPDIMVQLFEDSNKGWLFMAFISMFGYIFFEGFALVRMARRLGYRVSAVNGMTYGGADVYFSAITPSATGGQPASAYFMIKDGIAPSMVAVMLLINLVMYTAALLIAAVCVVLFGHHIFFGFSLAGKILVGVGGVILAGLMFGFFLLLKKTSFLHNIFDKLLNFLVKIHVIRHYERRKAQLENAMREYKECSDFIFGRGKLLAEVLLWNLLQRISYLLVIFMVFMATNHGIVKAIKAMEIQCLVTVGSNCIPVPGAMGVADFLMIDGLGQIINADNVVAMELICRGMTFYSSVIVGLLVVIIGYLRRKEKKN